MGSPFDILFLVLLAWMAWDVFTDDWRTDGGRR